MTKTPKLGQHFLTRSEIAGWVIEAINPPADTPVVEIGPGHGVLTGELLARGHHVIAIEKDLALVHELKQTFKQEIHDARLVLLEEDVRNIDPAVCIDIPEEYMLIANIPYYITGQILRTFLQTTKQPCAMSLLVQKEVAQRVVARDKKHSVLSLSVHAFGTPSIYKQVKAGAFSPPPKVDSAILAVKDVSQERFQNMEQIDTFFTIVKTAFSQKRKMLTSTLKDTVSLEVLETCSVAKTARPEDVPLENWLCVSAKISEQN